MGGGRAEQDHEARQEEPRHGHGQKKRAEPKTERDADVTVADLRAVDDVGAALAAFPVP